MPFALLMTDVLKRVEAGDPKAVKFRNRLLRLFLFITLQEPDVPVPVLACNLKAIGPAERPHYDELVERIRSAVRNRRAISDGYVFKLDSKTVSLPETAEWIGMERLCCPFLTLQLSAFGDRTDCILTLTGPEGVKPFLDAEFPVP
jgi:hypothetical protein